MKLWSKRTAGLLQVAIIAGGSATYSIAQWLILILFARETSLSEMGKYSYALSISAPFFIFFALSLRQVYISDSRKSGAWREYLILRLLATTVALIIANVFASLNGTLTGIYLLVSFIKAVDLVGDIWLAPAQAAGKSRSLGIYHFINGVSSLTLFVAGLVLGIDPVYALAMSLVGSLIAASYSLWVGRTSLPKMRSCPCAHGGTLRKSIWKLAILTAPLGFAGSLNSATQAAPGFFLERSVGLSGVGVFSAMVYLLLAGNTVVSAVVQYELPRTVAAFQKNGRPSMHRRVKLLTIRVVILSLIVTGAVLLWGESVTELLYGPGYGHRSALVILGISWAVGAVSWIWDMALVVERAFFFQMLAAGFGFMVAVIASFILVESFDVLGAALATLLAQIAVAGVRLLGLFIIAFRSKSQVRD